MSKIRIDSVKIVFWNDEGDPDPEDQQYDLVFEGEGVPPDELALYRDEVLRTLRRVLR